MWLHYRFLYGHYDTSSFIFNFFHDNPQHEICLFPWLLHAGLRFSVSSWPQDALPGSTLPIHTLPVYMWSLEFFGLNVHFFTLTDTDPPLPVFIRFGEIILELSAECLWHNLVSSGLTACPSCQIIYKQVKSIAARTDTWRILLLTPIYCENSQSITIFHLLLLNQLLGLKDDPFLPFNSKLPGEFTIIMLSTSLTIFNVNLTCNFLHPLKMTTIFKILWQGIHFLLEDHQF